MKMKKMITKTVVALSLLSAGVVATTVIVPSGNVVYAEEMEEFYKETLKSEIVKAEAIYFDHYGYTEESFYEFINYDIGIVNIIAEAKESMVKDYIDFNSANEAYGKYINLLRTALFKLAYSGDFKTLSEWGYDTTELQNLYDEVHSAVKTGNIFNNISNVYTWDSYREFYWEIVGYYGWAVVYLENEFAEIQVAKYVAEANETVNVFKNALPKLVLNDTDFQDITSCSTEAKTAIAWLLENGITTGYNATTFAPKNTLTRAEMVTFLYRLSGKPDVAINDFPDTTGLGQAFRQAISWAKETGVTTGYNATTFAPSQPVLREQMASFFYRLAGKPVGSFSYSFEDVPTESTHSQAIGWLSQTGVTSGYSPSAYGPSDAVTREQMALFLKRYADKVGVKAS